MCRFCKYLGYDGAYASSISLSEFEKSYFFVVYTLQADTLEVLGLNKAVRTGPLRLDCTFNRAISFPIEVCVFSEYTETLGITKTGSIDSTYLDLRA